MNGGPLADILVVDLTRALAGPHAAMMLGDLGARVIKVETPGNGDDTRGWGPPFVDPPGGRATIRRPVSTYFLSCNRNKESITLDLKSEDGRAALTELVRRGDVLLENFRPGVLDRLGFAQERLDELNPRLVVLSISGFGHDGPEGGRAGYDQIAQGEAGLMSMTGPDPDTPSKVGVPISDLLAGMYGAYGVLAKLHERERTGRGGLVRTSLLASVVGVHAYQGTRWTVAGEIPQAEGPHHPSICPYGLFHSADGAVQIAVGSEGLWARFAPAFDLPAGRPAVRHQRGPGPQRRRGQGGGGRGVRAVHDRRPAREALRDRRAQRRGQGPAAGLRVGPDPFAGPAGRRRAPVARPDHAAGAAAAVLRLGRRRSGTASTPRRRCWASTRPRCWAGSAPARRDRLTGARARGDTGDPRPAGRPA